jgi:DNA-binding transcriptional LysR family regulator
VDLRYAQAFFEAASSLHFGKAAKQLAIAPSAMTRQIQLFENSVGESLFVRSNRKVILTPRGKELFQLLSPIFLGHNNPVSKVRIGGLAGVIDNHFWSAARKIIDSHPIELSVIESNSTPALERLLNGELDIAFVNEKSGHDLVQYFSLGKEELVLVSKQRISLKELQNHTWIFCGRGDKLRSLSKIESKTQIRVSSVNKILDLVEMGLGIGIVPVSEKLHLRNLHVASLPIRNRDTYIAILKYEKKPAIIQEIIDCITR